jgi:hypothetical protein
MRKMLLICLVAACSSNESASVSPLDGGGLGIDSAVADVGAADRMTADSILKDAGTADRMTADSMLADAGGADRMTADSMPADAGGADRGLSVDTMEGSSVDAWDYDAGCPHDWCYQYGCQPWMQPENPDFPNIMCWKCGDTNGRCCTGDLKCSDPNAECIQLPTATIPGCIIQRG